MTFYHHIQSPSQALIDTTPNSHLWVAIFLHNVPTPSLFQLGSITNHLTLFFPNAQDSRYGVPSNHNADVTRSKSSPLISSFSYIKPQLRLWWCALAVVVYHPFPTSNHNCQSAGHRTMKLYIILFLHQTTTVAGLG